MRHDWIKEKQRAKEIIYRLSCLVTWSRAGQAFWMYQICLWTGSAR